MVSFMDALNAIGNYKKVTCVVPGLFPGKAVYEVVDGELTVNGKPKDYRDFCFSPSQILFGEWTVEDK